MSRTPLGGGFHWEVVTEFVSPCEAVTVVERPPPGAFVDPDQLRREANAAGAPRLVEPGPRVDVEGPREAAGGAQGMEVRWVPTHVKREREGAGWKVRGVVPYHLRYHAPGPAGATTVKVTIPGPSVMCGDELLPLRLPDVDLFVPVGHAEDREWVAGVTSLVVALATIAILAASLMGGQGEPRRHDKTQ